MLSRLPTTDDMLRKHRKHVFVLTSAGKPVFTRHGNVAEFSELFAVFQVLIAMARQGCGGDTETQGRQSRNLRRITAGDMNMHFYLEGELFYVLATRTGESARSCVQQLRQLHLQVLSFVPNICSILSKNSSYDVRQLISPADANLMRQLIRRNSHEECYLFRCLAVASLSVKSRQWLESLLARSYGAVLTADNNARSNKKDDDGVGGFDGTARTKAENGATEIGKHHRYSFFFFRGRVVCAVGPHDSDAQLSIDDALLLQNFTRCLADSQTGEIWAPLCLPDHNNTGYLWCYCVNMSVMVREFCRGQTRAEFSACAERSLEDQGEQAQFPQQSTNGVDGGRKMSLEKCSLDETTKTGSTTLNLLLEKTPDAYTKSGGLLLVHIAASSEAFLDFAEQTCQMARQMMETIVSLEEELSRRENISLFSFLSGAEVAQQQEQQLRLFGSGDTFPVSSSSSAPMNTTGNISFSLSFVHPDGLQWFAAVLRQRACAREEAPLLVYSEPSPTMRLSVRERKRQLRLVVRQRDKLLRGSCSSDSLVLLRMKDMNLVIMRTTPALVASLVQQFCSTSVFEPVLPNKMSGAGGETFVSTNKAVAACRWVRELMFLFLPHVSNAGMIQCALRVLVRLAARGDELTFQQVRGGRR